MAVVKRLLLGTGNRGKVRELARLLDGLGLEIVSLADFPEVPEVEEDGTTLLDNARKKAMAYAAATGLPTLADDSGLEVDALDGAPGVYSARYAGPQQDAQANIDKLLHDLRGVEPARRGARFRCVLVVARGDGETLVAEGTCEGRIETRRSGDGGFGYDPVFFYPPEGCTFAELDATRKNEISHRAAAFEALRPYLTGFLEST